MFAEASLIEHNLNLPKLTTSLDGLSESLRNYLSQDAIYGIKFKLRTSISMCFRVVKNGSAYVRDLLEAESDRARERVMTCVLSV